jgi:hypothetical protein
LASGEQFELKISICHHACAFTVSCKAQYVLILENENFVKKYYIPLYPLRATGRFRTLNLQIVGQAVYHGATNTGNISWKNLTPILSLSLFYSIMGKFITISLFKLILAQSSLSGS